MGAFSLERQFCPLRASKRPGKGLAPLFSLRPANARVTCERTPLSDADVWAGCSAEAVLRKEEKTVVFDGKAGLRVISKRQAARN
jgi:hypothetical protein